MTALESLRICPKADTSRHCFMFKRQTLFLFTVSSRSLLDMGVE